MNAPTPDWHARAAAVAIDGRCLINGRRVASTNSQTFDCISPLNGKVLGQIARGQAADIDAAVAAARRAFTARSWAGQPPAARKRILQAFAANILAHRDELALLETIDMGKPIKNSLAADVPGSANCIAWYAEAIDKIYGEIAPTGDDALALIEREPMGVIGVIVPWN